MINSRHGDEEQRDRQTEKKNTYLSIFNIVRMRAKINWACHYRVLIWAVESQGSDGDLSLAVANRIKAGNSEIVGSGASYRANSSQNLDRAGICIMRGIDLEDLICRRCCGNALALHLFYIVVVHVPLPGCLVRAVAVPDHQVGQRVMQGFVAAPIGLSLQLSNQIKEKSRPSLPALAIEIFV